MPLLCPACGEQFLIVDEPDHVEVPTTTDEGLELQRITRISNLRSAVYRSRPL